MVNVTREIGNAVKCDYKYFFFFLVEDNILSNHKQCKYKGV